MGQRRGLRLGDPAGDGRPRYVLEVSVADNTLTVGPAEALAVGTVTAEEAVVWLDAPPAPGSTLHAQVRAHGTAVPCTVAEGRRRRPAGRRRGRAHRRQRRPDRGALRRRPRGRQRHHHRHRAPPPSPPDGPRPERARQDGNFLRPWACRRARRAAPWAHEHRDLPGGGRPGAARAADDDAGRRGRAAALGRHDVVGAGRAGVGRQRPVVVPHGVDRVVPSGDAVGVRRRHPRRRPGGGQRGRPGAGQLRRRHRGDRRHDGHDPRRPHRPGPGRAEPAVRVQRRPRHGLDRPRRPRRRLLRDVPVLDHAGLGAGVRPRAARHAPGVLRGPERVAPRHP